MEVIRLRNVIRRQDIRAVSTAAYRTWIGPGCAREGVFRLQAAGASHWAAGRYSSTSDYDSAFNRAGKLTVNDDVLRPVT
jgi:hypothetical protein